MTRAERDRLNRTRQHDEGDLDPLEDNDLADETTANWTIFNPADERIDDDETNSP